VTTRDRGCHSERSEESGGGDSMAEYYVYLMGSYRGTLYTGVTNDLMCRVYEHQNKLVDG
jgi:hypothetical protein